LLHDQDVQRRSGEAFLLSTVVHRYERMKEVSVRTET